MTTSQNNRPSLNVWSWLKGRPAALAALMLMIVSIAVIWGPWSSALEQRALTWLQNRQTESQSQTYKLASVPEDMEALSQPQALLVSWLSRKYRVAPEPLSSIVVEAFEIGAEKRLDPALILAVAANESRFNPLAQSPVGAQGLMQVLTRVHLEKFEPWGGEQAAFDPLTNLRVGSKILQETIRRAGSVEGGLRFYVGAVKTDGSDYVNKVMAEQLRLHQVMAGKPTSFTAIPEGMPVLEPAGELVAASEAY